MGVVHSTPAVGDLAAVSEDQAINLALEQAVHPGIGQFRVGNFAVTILEMTHAVTFETPMPDTSYEVFMLPLGNLGGQYWASNLLTTGFTANFSSGANVTFSYMAVDDV